MPEQTTPTESRLFAPIGLGYKPMSYLPTDVAGELHDIGVMQTVLEAMDPTGRRRALNYLSDRYGRHDA